MGARSFKIALALIGALVLLSAMPFPGAMIGFLCGIAVAFFIAPLTFLLESVARMAGVPVAFQHVVYALIALYGLAVLLLVREAQRSHALGDAAATRLSAAKATLLAALPLVAWLSSQALVRAWR